MGCHIAYKSFPNSVHNFHLRTVQGKGSPPPFSFSFTLVFWQKRKPRSLKTEIAGLASHWAILNGQDGLRGLIFGSSRVFSWPCTISLSLATVAFKYGMWGSLHRSNLERWWCWWFIRKKVFLMRKALGLFKVKSGTIVPPVGVCICLPFSAKNIISPGTFSHWLPWCVLT